ncbi:MAG: hypothetical protein AUJ98_05040 [Bacteroidetes bacterium CG2_30_33_31]|nr:MAG: hypothetical protein AUJ98_05040 [Bacteroidetes bacterium CG2_30_33_31]
MEAIKDTVFYKDAFLFNQIPANILDTIKIAPKHPAATIFQKSSLSAHSFSQKVLIQKSNFQPFWILLLSLIIFAIMRMVFVKYMKYRILGFFIEKYHGVNYTTEQAAGLIPQIINIIFYANISVFVFELLHIFGVKTNPTADLKYFGIITLIVLLFSVAKTLIITLSGLLFSTYDNAMQLINIKNDSGFAKTVALVPLNFILIYGYNNLIFSYISLGIIATIFLIKIFKMYLQIRASSNFQVYQIFLYLCSLEILPFFILYKLLNIYI